MADGIAGFIHTGFGFRRLGVEHIDGTHHQQHAATNLETGQGDAEKRQNAQTQQGTGHQHHQHGKTRDADCFLSQRRIKALRDVNEKGNAGQRIHQCEQGHQGLEGK